MVTVDYERLYQKGRRRGRVGERRKGRRERKGKKGVLSGWHLLLIELVSITLS